MDFMIPDKFIALTAIDDRARKYTVYLNIDTISDIHKFPTLDYTTIITTNGSSYNVTDSVERIFKKMENFLN